LPASVQALLSSRIESLPPEEKVVVLTASLHAEQVDTELLQHVLGRPVPRETIKHLVDADIMHPAPTNTAGQGQRMAVRFKHGLVRDVARSLLPLDKRRTLHRAYANALLRGSNPEAIMQMTELLAMHFVGSEDYENALKFSETSGDKALAASALDQAMWHFETALSTIDKMPQTPELKRRWVAIARKWAIPCVYSASHDHLPMLEKAETIAREIGDFSAVAWARYWIGYLKFVLGDTVQALSCLRMAKEIALQHEDARLVAEALAIEGCILGSIAQSDDAERCMRDAILAKDRNPRRQQTVPVTSVYTRANLALLIADQGRFDEANTLISEALNRVSGSSHEVESSVLNYAAVISLMQRNWADALAYAKRSRERSEKVSSAQLMAMSRCIWGFAHWKENGAVEGVEMLTKAAQWMELSGMRLYLSLPLGWLAEAMMDLNRYDEALAACDAALERAHSGEIIGVSMACRAAAEVSIACAKFDQAERYLAQADLFAEKRGAEYELAANQLTAAHLYLTRQDSAAASAALNAAGAMFSSLQMTHWQGHAKPRQAGKV